MKHVRLFCITYLVLFIITYCSCGSSKDDSAFSDNPEIKFKVDFIYPDGTSDTPTSFPLNGNIIALFNKDVDFSTVTSSTFKITQNGSSESLQGTPAQYDKDKRVIMYNITSPILEYSNYKLTLENIRSTDGDTLQQQNYYFITNDADDTTSPNPLIVNKSSSEIQVMFKPDNIIIDPSSLNEEMIKLFDTAASMGDPGISFTAEYNVEDKILYIWPKEELDYYNKDGELIEYCIEMQKDAIVTLSGVGLVSVETLNFQFIEGEKIVRETGGNRDCFGNTVAISGDGQTIVVGAPGEYVNYDNQGAVYVYRNGQLSNPTRLIDSNGNIGDKFGSSVAISDDGQTIVVGAEGADGNNTCQGAVFVYLNGDLANPVTLTQDDDKSDNYFGCSVAVSSDGNVIVVGAYGMNSWTGCAYAYVNKQFDDPYVLLPSGSASYDKVGYSVAVSNDGSTVIIGAIGVNANLGSAYVYADNQYVTYTTLQKSDGVAYDWFGSAIAVSGNGSMIIIGSHTMDVNSINDGGMLLYSDFDFDNPILITAHDGEEKDLFGKSIALSNDGSVIIVGAYQADGSQVNEGAVYIFENENYTYPQKITSNEDTAGDDFGYSVDITNDGVSFVVGAPYADVYDTNDGAFFYFSSY